MDFTYSYATGLLLTNQSDNAHDQQAKLKVEELDVQLCYWFAIDQSIRQCT